INFGNTTFTGLGDGALFVGAGAKVTISESSLLYGNKPSGMSERMTNFQRNIVCDGQEDKKAQLNAQVVSFIEKEKEEEEENQLNNIKWIQRNPKTCELSGSIASAENLMFTQQIDGIDTSIQDDIGIQVLVTGKQLFGCGKMWLNISGQASTSNEEITKSYNFEGITQDWDSDTDITLLIPFDDDLVKEGNKIQILALVGDTAESAKPVQSSKGGSIVVVEMDVIKDNKTGGDITKELPPVPDDTQPTQDSKGISTGALIGIIIGVIAAIIVIVIIVVILLYCNMKSSKSKRAHHDQTSRSQIRNTHRANQGSGRRARHYEMEENNW
ncbi:MAG: hypothetical protein EZS28_019479, partial [Streblomastix strix]